MQLIPQGSFEQKEQEVIELLKRKSSSGKLSNVGQVFLEKFSTPQKANQSSTPHDRK